MKLLIAADMEGISGVVHWDQVSTTHPEYGRFRKIMTEDVNAAIRGALDAGADDVIVTDGHSYGRNILIEALDPRARLNSGSSPHLSMVQGVDQGVGGVFFIGYHARIGAQQAILEHTWSDERVADLWLNGARYGEIGLNAAVCGHFNVPVAMISGDQTACAEAESLIPGIVTAVVKWPSGRMAAECLAPSTAQERIQEAAAHSVRRLLVGHAPAPFRLDTPIEVAVDFVQSEMADRASVMPGAERREGRRVSYLAQDMITVYRAFRTLLALAKG